MLWITSHCNLGSTAICWLRNIKKGESYLSSTTWRNTFCVRMRHLQPVCCSS